MSSPAPWSATVLTLFPEMFPGPLGARCWARRWSAGCGRLRCAISASMGLGKHRSVDDTPAGGGPGMVMRADVASAALDAARAEGATGPAIYLSPRGRAPGSGAGARTGRRAGRDAAVRALRGARPARHRGARPRRGRASGDFVLAGGRDRGHGADRGRGAADPRRAGRRGQPHRGELSAKICLEYPQFTRPQEFEGRPIPEVLTGGNHKEIARWRRAQAEALTRDAAPRSLRPL